ncbi:hypothetical protein [Muricoccus vinaceus]|uniref:Uncharacterized protein n=1 Tax=Muricoccus vinaceus TaxID=424704 RepID=A0ABV6J174_9PROT
MPDDQRKRDYALLRQIREDATPEERDRIAHAFTAFQATFNSAFHQLSLASDWETATAWARMTVSAATTIQDGEERPLILPSGKALVHSQDRKADDALLDLVEKERQRAKQERRKPNLTSVAREACATIPRFQNTTEISVKRHINRLLKQAVELAAMPSPFKDLFSNPDRDI